MIADDLGKQLGLALDLAVFEGTGSSTDPQGIAGTANVSLTSRMVTGNPANP